MARALSPSLLFLLFAPLIKAQETVLRKAFRLTILCLFIVSVAITVTAQQRILWQGRVRPEQINVYTSASLSDRAAITLKQGDVVDVVLQITWQDKAGNALPISDTDNGPGGTGATVSFSTLSAAQGETNPESLNGDTLQANLIMPEPTHFIDQGLGPVAVVRPTSTKFGGAVASFQSFVDDGRFIGQPKHFFDLLFDLANEADQATRQI